MSIDKEKFPEIIKRIDEIKKESGLTNERIAQRVGLSVFTLSRVRKSTNPRRSTIALLVRFIHDYETAKKKGRIALVNFLTPSY